MNKVDDDDDDDDDNAFNQALKVCEPGSTDQLTPEMLEGLSLEELFRVADKIGQWY